jgi:hypothetical protein
MPGALLTYLAGYLLGYDVIALKEELKCKTPLMVGPMLRVRNISYTYESCGHNTI